MLQCWPNTCPSRFSASVRSPKIEHYATEFTHSPILQAEALRRSRGTMSDSAAAISDAVESIFLAGWTNFPALRAVPGERRERLEKFESLLSSHDRTNAVVSGDSGAVVVLFGACDAGTIHGNDPVTPPRESSGASPSAKGAFSGDTTAIPDAVLFEHFGFLKMLHRQLLHAVEDFGSEAGTGGEFWYENVDTAGEEGGAMAGRPSKPEPKPPKLVVPSGGLSPRALEDVANAAQWIRGVAEGAARVHRVVLASVAPPDTWVRNVPENAKDAVGVHLYNDLNEHVNVFDPERVADQEGYAGTSGGGARWSDKKRANAPGASQTLESDSESDASSRSEDVKSNKEACELLNQLERAEFAWREKKQNQEVLDSLRIVRIDPTAVVTLGLLRSPGTGRVSDITRRIANASALGETIRARYPRAPPTALQRAKQKCVRGDECDVATAALEAFARCLAAVATALNARALEVQRAHWKAIAGSGGRESALGNDGRLVRLKSKRRVGWFEGETFVDKLRRASRLTGEWCADTGRQLRAEMEALMGVRVVDVKNIACCGASGDSGRLGR